MASHLPVKKIYVDSQFMTSDSVSGSNFKFPAALPITLPTECMCLIDDVCIPHAWYSVETNLNDMIFIYISYTGGIGGTPVLSFDLPRSYALQIPPGNYSGTLFADKIQQLIDNPFSDTLKVTYNGITSNITISTTSTAPTNLNFQILTDADCITRLNCLYVLSNRP